jgi:hypothetical protein
MDHIRGLKTAGARKINRQDLQDLFRIDRIITLAWEFIPRITGMDQMGTIRFPSHPTSPIPSSLPVIREGRRGMARAVLGPGEERWDGSCKKNPSGTRIEERI